MLLITKEVYELVHLPFWVSVFLIYYCPQFSAGIFKAFYTSVFYCENEVKVNKRVSYGFLCVTDFCTIF